MTLKLTVHVEDRRPSCVLDQDPGQRHGYHCTSIGSCTGHNIMTKQNLILAAHSESRVVPQLCSVDIYTHSKGQCFVIRNLLFSV